MRGRVVGGGRGGHQHYVKEQKLTSTHFYFTSTLPFNELVAKYSQTHITSTTSTTSTTFGALGGGGEQDYQVILLLEGGEVEDMNTT